MVFTKIIKASILVFCLFGFFSLVNVSQAQSAYISSFINTESFSDNLVPARIMLAQSTPQNQPPSRANNWGLDTAAQNSGLTQGATPESFSTVVGKLIGPLLGIIGSLFVVLLIYAGVLWMTAQGSEERVGKAKKIIYTSIIGILIVIFAYAIAQFIVSRIIEGQGAKPITGGACVYQDSSSSCGTNLSCSTTASGSDCITSYNGVFYFNRACADVCP